MTHTCAYHVWVMPKEKTSSSIYIYIQNTLYVLRSFLHSMLPTRHYTKDLGFALGSLLEEQQHHPPLDLRNKRHVAPAMTDREIFDSMSLGDCWWDAELPQLYWYLKKKLPNLSIPESWEETMETFERELFQVPCLDQSCPRGLQGLHNDVYQIHVYGLRSKSPTQKI